MGQPLPAVTLPKRVTDREVYLAVAAASGPETDVLAGIVRHVLLLRPNLAAARLRELSTTVATAIAQHRPDPARDLSPDDAFRMSRILVAVVPHLTTTPLREAATGYTREFLRSFRQGAGQRRQVQPLDLQFDRVPNVRRLCRQIWAGLYDTAVARPAVAAGIDTGPLGAALGIGTGDAAAVAVTKVDLPVLRTLVEQHIQPNGALSMPAGGVQSTLGAISGSVSGVRDQYTTTLIEINVSIGKAEDKKTPENLSALDKAIKKAEELDKQLKDAADGSKEALGVLAAVADLVDAEFGNDIREFATISVGMLTAAQKAARASAQVGKFIQGIASASSCELFLGGGIGFAFVMTALMIQATGLFGGRSKPIEQVILEELRKLAELVAELRDEMRVRFDRIDARLDRMYSGLLARLAEIDFNLGQVEGNVEELQASLYQLHTELTRLTADFQAQLDAAHRRDLVEGINGFLNFQERTGQPIDNETFLEAENLFFTWGNDHARDPLQAGPEERPFTDDDLLTELTRFSTATNINYLRLAPAERFGLAPLASGRLANPLDWIVAAEAYAQLSEESPALAAPISDNRVAALIEIGAALGTALSRIADPQLFDTLHDHYRTRYDDLRRAISDAEAQFRIAPRHQLHNITLFGGAEQGPPDEHFFNSDRETWVELGRCGGGRFDDKVAKLSTAAITDLNLTPLRPYLIADNLSNSSLPGVASGLRKLSACIAASWRLISSEEPGLGNIVRLTYELSMHVNINYGTEVVYRYTADTRERFIASVPKSELGSFDPTTGPRGKNPYPLLVGDKKLWSKLTTFPRREAIVDPAARAATVTTVAAKLRLAQRAFYNQVAERLGQAGDPIGRFGRRLTGAKLLWQQLVVAGFPLSVQANEILRGLVLGGNALLAGSDAEAEDALLDDVRDLYAFFGTRREDPPAANISAELRTLALGRATQLKTLLDGIVAAGNPPEPPQVFAPTLLRLSLL
ncbi:hypothetical protein GCM10009558_013380 [Virgisporangium aurantiacum]